MGRLDDVDLSLKLKRRSTRSGSRRAQQRLLQLRLLCAGLTGDGELGPPVACVFEGWDACGKGGAIKRLLAELDSRHVRVALVRGADARREAPPLPLALLAERCPGWGGMAVFDRSWYGRVLVERVEGFATEEEWRRGYDEIIDFERELADEGMLLVKFWMHVSDEEQLARFESARDDPLKSWKLTDEDWRNREKRPSTRRRSRRCSSAPTTTAAAGTSSRATRRSTRAWPSSRRCARRSSRPRRHGRCPSRRTRRAHPRLAG